MTEDVAGSRGYRRFARDGARLRAIARLAPGKWFRTTIVASRSSGTHLYLDTWMRDAASAGDDVRVTLRPDGRPRDLPVPAALQRRLKSNSDASRAWNMLSPSRQREILTYLNFLKTPAALERNIEKTISRLRASE